MAVRSQVAIDANCFTYLVEALQDVHEPVDLLADERKALVWLFLRGEPALCTVPCNDREIRAISDNARREWHLQWLSMALSTAVPSSHSDVVERTCVNLTAHDSSPDCAAVAEAASADCVAFLSCDKRLLSRLSAYAAPMQLLRPSLFWASLSIPRGSPARWRPHSSNPLAAQAWIKW